MSVDDAKLAVLIEANTRSYENAMKRLEQKTDKAMKMASRNTRKLSREMTRLEKISQKTSATIKKGFAAVLTVESIRRLGSHFLSVGADVEEMESKFEAVFRELSGGVDRWATKHAALVSRSALDLKEYLSGLQDTFVPLGFAREKGAELSKTLVELAIDVASFSNAAEPEVINSFTSAIIGNHEAVRKYGIIITQTVLNQELLNQGVKGGAKSASEQEKVLARLGIIMRSTSDAQGDAAKTAESYTNKTKELAGAWKDFSAEVGGFLITYGAPVLQFFTDGMRGATMFADSLRSLENRKLAGPLKRELADVYAERQKFMDLLTSNISGPTPGIVAPAALSNAKKQLDVLLNKAGKLEAQINRIEHGPRGGEKSQSFKPEPIKIKPVVPLTSARKKQIADIEREQKAISDLAASMRLEIEMVRMTDLERAKANATRNLGISATPQQVAGIENLVEALHREVNEYEAILDAQNLFADSAFDSILGVIEGTESASDAMKSFAREIARAALQATLLGKGPLSGLFGTQQRGGILGRIFGSILGRAGGGHVSAGRPYEINERGGEIFIPNTSGKIVNHHNSGGQNAGMSGSVVLNQVFSFDGAIPAEEIYRIADQAGARAHEGVKVAFPGWQTQLNTNGRIA